MVPAAPGRLLLALLLALPWAVGAPAAAEEAPVEPSDEPTPEVLVLKDALHLAGATRPVRTAAGTDPVEAAMIAGTWQPPTAGDKVPGPDGSERVWAALAANEQGVFEGEAAAAGAYFSFRIASAEERVWVLRGRGHDFVYVNGAWRPGDPYGHGYLRTPVVLRKGENEVLLRASRGRLEARLEAPPAPVFLVADDATLPSRVPGETPDGPGAVVVVNATREAVDAWVGPAEPVKDAAEAAPAVRVPALSSRKVPLALRAAQAPLAGAPEDLRLVLEVRGAAGGLAGEAAVPWPVTRAGDPVRVRTFASAVDGSVQYYATCGPRGPAGPPRALVLALHGASVEARGLAPCYAPRPWATVVVPTNRRPFGFDWEDWGRLDAIEVLDLELAEGGYDPARVHVTGHSMGGHGAWQMGVAFPGRFATVCPSAGWISFATYGGAPKDPPADAIEAMLRRAAASSDTLSLATNLATKGVFVLHGDADDNVPVTEARTMVERLTGLVPDLHVHEEKGAGHWWDKSPEPGTDCVDWPGFFDLMARRRLPPAAEVREVDFATASPGVSARHAWATVVAQERAQVVSRVRLRLDPLTPAVEGTTQNVARLELDLSHAARGKPVAVRLDGGSLEAPALPAEGPAVVRLERRDGAWSQRAQPWPIEEKGPRRCGPFKAAFRDRFALVVGTAGTPEETAWAEGKARADAEAWYYRANGSVDLVTDAEFLARPDAWEGRSLVLYGHAGMNRAFDALLPGCPVRVERGSVRAGEREVRGDHLACLFLRPRAGTATACVAVIAGTGLPGLRLTDRLNYFSSGVGYPDFFLLSTDLRTKGLAGILAAGFFGLDWSLSSGEVAWR